METTLQNELNTLKVDVLKMLHAAQDALKKAVRGLLEGRTDLARDVVDEDRDINDLECRIDSDSLRLLALHQPVAKDLRFIVGCMRMIVNIERLGDEAASIAERLLLIQEKPHLAVTPHLRMLAELSLELSQKTIKSFMDLDSDAAQQIYEHNADAVNLYMKVFKEATEYMIQESRTVDRAVQYSFIAHSLKRICDQCSNVAESIIFIKDGVDCKHQFLFK